MKKTKRKKFISKYSRICMNSRVKPQKQTLFIPKSMKQQLTNSGVITNILGVSGLELYSSSTKPVTFFGAKSSLGGSTPRLGGTSSDLGGHGPGMHPRGVWRVTNNEYFKQASYSSSRKYFNSPTLPSNAQREHQNRSLIFQISEQPVK